MKVLTQHETEQVSGGLAVFGISGIETGLALFSQASAVGRMAAASFTIGYGIGTGINYLWEAATGNTIGGSLYNTFGC
jgi:hypothetical protein